MKLWPLRLVALLLCTCGARAVTVYHAYEYLTSVPSMTVNVTKALLAGNLISHIQGQDLAAYQILQSLDMKYNRLTQFPNVTAVASTLEELSLNHNRIFHIHPEYLDSLGVLRKLQLAGNFLQTIPDVAGPSNTLRILTLSDNRFTSFPRMSQLGAMVSTLKLEQNQIHSIHPTDLMGLGSRDDIYSVALWLNSNQLEELPDIRPLNETLAVLYLADNKIKRINWSYLTETTYHENIFGIYLERNSITELEMPCGRLPQGLIISLEMNPLNCDCKLQWLKNGWTAKATFRLSANPCVSPPMLIGRRWETEIAAEDMSCTGDDPKRRQLVFRDTHQPTACSLPSINVVGTHTASDPTQCALRCLTTPECYDFYVDTPIPGHMTCYLTSMLAPVLTNTAYKQVLPQSVKHFTAL